MNTPRIEAFTYDQDGRLLTAPRSRRTDLDDGQVAEDIRTMRMATAVNALGLPAVAVPVGVAEGLPQAVQVVGPGYREDLCLEAAAAIEERLGILTPIEFRGRDKHERGDTYARR